VRIQFRHRFVIATPTPLAWRKAVSGQPLTRGCFGVAVNPGELTTSPELGPGSAQPESNQVPREMRASPGSEQTLDEEYLQPRETRGGREG
jgi:hypothetical protein